MSQLEVDKIIPQSGTTLTIGDSGDTINFADGQNINIDSNTLYIDSTNNRVGIGTSSPGAKLEIQTNTDWGNIINSTYSGTQYLQQFEYNGSSIGKIRGDNSSIAIESGSNLILQTANTERMRIDSSGNVGINQSSPEQKLDVQGIIQIETATSATRRLRIKDSVTSQYFDIGVAISSSQPNLTFSDGTDERMRIDSSGNVGIGTTSPSVTLDVNGGTSNTVAQFNSTDSNCNIGIFDNSTTGIYLSAIGDDFTIKTASSEAMRIDSSGNVLVAGTNTDPSATNSSGIALKTNGKISATRDGEIAGDFNRQTSDGNIVRFRKDGTTIGSIGVVNNNNLFIQGDSTNSGLQCGTNNILPVQNNANADNAIDLGLSNIRWKDLYLGGGVYLGGTGSANKLDDYEEGTWTPTAGSGVTGFTVISADYIKIGETITIRAYLNNFSGAGASQLVIGGLPFSSGSDGYWFGILEGGASGASYKMGVLRTGSGSTNLNCFYPNTSNANRTNYTGNDLGNFLILSLTYTTT